MSDERKFRPEPLSTKELEVAMETLAEELQDIEWEDAIDIEAVEVAASGTGDRGMGTKVAEYGEDGPYHCMDCWFLTNREPRSEPLGRCNEKHMMADPDVPKDETGLAIVNKRLGCCRYVDPVKCEGANPKFSFAHNSKEEEKEHQA